MKPFQSLRILSCLALVAIFACNKAKTNPGSGDSGGATTPRHVIYLVKGTKFNLNYIDSNNVFHQNVVQTDSFHYEFNKGAGGNIGISISKFASTDVIYSWEVFIEGKLYANAFSEGGAYMVVPYTLF